MESTSGLLPAGSRCELGVYFVLIQTSARCLKCANQIKAKRFVSKQRQCQPHFQPKVRSLRTQMYNGYNMYMKIGHVVCCTNVINR